MEENRLELTMLTTSPNPTLPQGDVSGSANDFEIELYKLINKYAFAGLKKPDLIHKLEYVTQSCRVS
jgi:hypothetical protein